MRRWQQVSKTCRKLRIERGQKDMARKSANAHYKCRADPFEFAKELFDPPNASAPTFDVHTAHDHL